MPRPQGGRERGVVLLEAFAALALLAMGLLGVVSLLLSGAGLATQTSVSADGTNVLRQVVAEIQSVPFDEVYARFNNDPSDDPDGPGTAVGNRRTLQPAARGLLLGTITLSAAEGARQVPVDVDITFPVDVDGVLSETASGPAWGDHTWDLNGDGEITAGDRSADYRLLPVRIRVSWSEPKGEGALEVVRLLSNR